MKLATWLVRWDDLMDQVKEFRERLEKLSREEILDIIDEQHPQTTTDIGWKKEILRKEWVFRNKLSHINDDQGNPIVEGDYTKEELVRLVDPPFIFSKDLMKAGLNQETQRQIHVASDPVLWSQQILGAQPRSYQALIMRDEHAKIVLRFGRRLGKTVSLTMYMLWYAYVHPKARVLVMAPAKNQVGLIYESIMDFADSSDIVKNAITKAKQSPQYEVWFTNGSSIKLFTTGLKSGSKSDGARGQEADMIILDEMDYMGSEDLVALLAMLQDTDSSKLFKKKLIGASTPTGQRSKYWLWNTDPKEGFHSYFFPAYVNPNWSQAVEEEMRVQYKNEQHYRHEIEADWGEDADGVYGRKYVDQSFNIVPSWDYRNIQLNHEKYKYFMGVDWDKHGAGVNVVAIQSPRNDPFGGPIKVLYREEIRKGDFTYLASIDEIIKLDERFNFEHIYVDQGAGEVQQELLHKYGLENPASRMHHKAKAWHFSNSIEVRDPYTRKKEKKRLKPLMVDNLNHFLENNKIIFNNDDEQLYLELISYIKLRENDSGYPVFSPGGDTADHAHDALLLSLFALTHNYDPMFENHVMEAPKSITNSFFMPNVSKPKVAKSKASELEEVIKNPSEMPQRASFGKPKKSKGNLVKRSRF